MHRTHCSAAGFGLTDLIVAAAVVGIATGLAVPMFGTRAATPVRLDRTVPAQEHAFFGVPVQPGPATAPGWGGDRTDPDAGHGSSEPTAAATDLPSPGGRN